MPPDTLTQLNLSIGEVCQIDSTDDSQTLGYGIAWRATDGIGSSPKVRPAKMTDHLRDAYDIKEGSHVNISKTNAQVVLAEKIILVDVTPSDYGKREELEDGRWYWRCGSLLSKSFQSIF
jgi:AAA family ATPase